MREIYVPNSQHITTHTAQTGKKYIFFKFNFKSSELKMSGFSPVVLRTNLSG